jgi:hypothetical protein
MSIPASGGSLSWPAQWPFLPVMERVGMAVAIGVFVGLEREHSGKLGTRTFGLIALLGCLAGLAGPQLIWAAMAFVLMLIWLINWRRLSAHDQLATTTSLSLTIVAICGVLCGIGHMYTPVLASDSVYSIARLETADPHLYERAHGARDTFGGPVGSSFGHYSAGAAITSGRSMAADRSTR